MKIHFQLCAIGILTGTVFGLFLKGIESLTKKRVYTLLLNVDYIPLLRDLELNESLEFLLHLIVSVIVVYVLYFGLRRLKWQQFITPYVVANLVIACGLFLTTSFSARTPALADLLALFYWVVGHVLYGLLLGLMIRYVIKE